MNCKKQIELLSTVFHVFRHCGTPIADHVHATNLHCRDGVLPDASILTCNDDYHGEINRIENTPFNDLRNFHKTMTRNITLLYKEKDATVTTADLDFYQIGLAWSVFTKSLDDHKVAY